MKSPLMNKLLFQTKYTRNNSKLKARSIRYGNVCPILVDGLPCSRNVIDLQTHLRRIHSLFPINVEFLQAIDSAKTCKREVFYKDTCSGEVKMNPYSHQLSHESSISNSFSDSSIPIPIDQSASSRDIENSSYDADSDEDNYSIPPLSCSNTFSDNSNTNISLSLEKFKNFLATTLGGSNSSTSINVTISNIFMLLNAVGERNLFDPETVNLHLTNESKSGKTPSTLIARVDSLSKFVNYVADFQRGVLPNNFELVRFCSIIKGLKKSLFKTKTKRQKIVMSRNRVRYPETIEFLKQWREKRKSLGLLELFEAYNDGELEVLSQNSYARLRDYLIVEILIPNSQRPGSICGLILKEIELAKTDITEEGFHKLFISDHKTGHLSSAVLFIYPDIFRAILIFIYKILPRLPIYQSYSSKITKDSHIFQTFTGSRLLSSYITPILRSFVSTMGINFNGTLTDIRKAAATMTGKHQPNLHETMANFLCHSLKAHDKYYMIQHGHRDLSLAFQSLERFQSIPTSTPTKSIPKISSNDDIIPANDGHNFYNCSIFQGDDNGEFTNVENSPSPNSVNSKGSTPKKSIVVTNSSSECDQDNYQDISLNIQLDNSEEIHTFIEQHRVSPHRSEYTLKSFSIPITKNIFLSKKASFFTKPDVFHSSLRPKSLRRCPKILKCCSLKRTEISNGPTQASHKTVRPLGVSKRRGNRCADNHIFVHPDISTSPSPLKSRINISEGTSPPRIHTKKLFVSQLEHLLFGEVFHDYILDVAEKRTVKKSDILLRLHTDKRIFPIVNRLKFAHNDDPYKKLVTKVRTLGYSQRKILLND